MVVLPCFLHCITTASLRVLSPTQCVFFLVSEREREEKVTSIA